MTDYNNDNLTLNSPTGSSTIPNSDTSSGLYKVATGSTDASGNTVFDVFNNGQHVSDPNDPLLKGVNIPDLPTGQAPSNYQSAFLPPSPTDKSAEDLYNKGAVITSNSIDQRNTQLADLEKRLSGSDQIVSQILAAGTPSDREKQLQDQIDQTTLSTKGGQNQELTREAPMALVTGRQGELARQASLKLEGLQRELTRLTGDRQAQASLLEKAYSLQHNNIQDLMEFYKATAPTSLYTDDRTGIAYFRNPITGEVTSAKLPGFVPKPQNPNDIYGSGIIGEYNFARANGYKGSFSQYQNEDANRKRSVTNNVNNSGVVNPLTGQPYSTIDISRYSRAANAIVKNFISLPQFNLTANGLPYLQRIQAADSIPGSVSDAELLDSIVKLNTGGNQVTEAQVKLITGGRSFADSLNVWQNKLNNGGVLSNTQREQLTALASKVFDRYKSDYQPIYDQVTKQLKDAGIPEAFWTIPDLNSLSSGGSNTTAPVGSISGSDVSSMTSYIQQAIKDTQNYPNREALINDIQKNNPQYNINDIAKLVYGTWGDNLLR